MKNVAIFVFAVVMVAMVAARPEPSYGGHKDHAVQPGPAKEYTFPAKAPAVKCSHNLLVACNPHKGVVPCKGHEPHYEAPKGY